MAIPGNSIELGFQATVFKIKKMQKPLSSLIFFLLFFSAPGIADNTSIKGLFEAISKIVTTKNYDAIDDLIYPLDSPVSTNKAWVLSGIRQPTEIRSNDNGFNMEALQKVIEHSERFKPVAESVNYQAIQKGFAKMFTEADPEHPFLNDLQNGGKHIYILEKPETKSMILIYRHHGKYQLVWWKEMIRVADQL